MNVSGGGNILTKLWQEPLLRSAYIELFKTLTYRTRAPDDKDDETIAEFFQRRKCPNVANNLVSAMIHGIYAGDIDELSVRAIFPSFVLWENRFGSPYEYLKWSLLNYFDITSVESKIMNYQQDEFNDFYADKVLRGVSGNEELMSASIYTLQGGLQTLSTALVNNLRQNPRVKLVTEATIKSIGPAWSTADHSKARKLLPKTNVKSLTCYRSVSQSIIRGQVVVRMDKTMTESSPQSQAQN